MNEQTRSVAIIIILGMCTFAIYLITGSDWSDNEPVLYAENEQSLWLEAHVHNQIAYFLQESPPQIQRFALNTETWLTPIALQQTPTAFAVDSDGLYVAEGDDVNHYQLNGANSTNILNDPEMFVRFIITADEYIYLYFVSGFVNGLISMDKTTAVIIDTISPYSSKSYNSAAIAPTLGKLFVQYVGLSPRNIEQIVLNGNGTFEPPNRAPYHMLIRIGSEVYTSPDEAYLIDNSGAVYATDSLSITHSLAGPLTDIAFYNQQPVVLREGFVYLYDEAYLEIGRQAVTNSATNLFVDGDNLFVFSSSGQVVKIPVADIPPAAPAPIVDPQATNYTADAFAWDEEDTLFILSREHQNIFRWSPSQRQYLTSIPLTGEAEYITFDSQNERLFVGYLSGRITTIDLDALVEQTFANNIPPYTDTNTSTCNIILIDNHVFVCSHIAWTTYQGDGMVIHRYIRFPTTRRMANNYAWDGVYRRLYYTRASFGNNLLWLEGDASGSYSWPPSQLQISDLPANVPMQLDQTHNTLLLGSGHIIDLETPVVTGELADTFDHATLLDGLLFSQKTFSSGSSQVTKWNANYQIVATATVLGPSIQLLTTPDNELVSVTEWMGKPLFTIWDENLNMLYQDSYGIVHLPLTLNNYCSDFYDDFTNPNRGWFVGENPIVKTAYVNGEYQVLNKVGGYINLLLAPGCAVPNSLVSVDARWAGIPGNSYGLLFGVNEDSSEFYIADLNTDLQMYRVLRYRHGQLQLIIGPHSSPHIHPGTAVNNLRVFVGTYSQTPKLFINGVDHGFIYESIRSGTRVGLVASGYQGQNNADARFDNFVFRRSASAFETASTRDIVLEPEELLTESWSVELDEPIWLTPGTDSISIPVLPAWLVTDSD
jgi:hypothetical protein